MTADEGLDCKGESRGEFFHLPKALAHTLKRIRSSVRYLLVWYIWKTWYSEIIALFRMGHFFSL